MPVYEITWRFRASSDEIAFEVFKGAERVHETVQTAPPVLSISLKKVLDE